MIAAASETKLPLAGIRVLVTRPLPQAAGWQTLLQSAGALTALVPLLEIVPIGEQSGSAWHSLRARIQDLDHYQQLIFVSQNAVRLGMEQVLRCWPRLPVGLRFHAIGSATAAALGAFDIDVVQVGTGMNSEALLQLPELQDVAGQRILIFRGAGGRPTLAEELERRGARVEYCELYQRQLPAGARAQLTGLGKSSATEVISVHSGETLQNLCRLFSELGNEGILSPTDWLQRPLLVPGERVRQLAAARGFSRVIVAANASDSSMLEALLAWAQQHSAAE